VVWYSGNAMVSINVYSYPTSGTVSTGMGNVYQFESHSHPLDNQPPRPTQPGHPSGEGKMSTGVKTGKVVAGYGRDVVYRP